MLGICVQFVIKSSVLKIKTVVALVTSGQWPSHLDNGILWLCARGVCSQQANYSVKSLNLFFGFL